MSSTMNVNSRSVCEKCQGTLVQDREVDLLTGMVLNVNLCINCGRRTSLGQDPRPLSGT